MSLVVDKCLDADFPRVFELVSLAFDQEHPYINVVFPNHETPAGRQAGATRFHEIFKTNPYANFIKVTDTQHRSGSPKIIAIAKWDFYQDSIPAEVDVDGPYWDDGEGDKAYAQEIFRAYLVPRRKAIRETGGNLASLDLMVVDPEEQRRGAGKLLMEWGVAEADRLGVKGVVEASTYGQGLYERYGFRFVRKYVLDMPEPWTQLRKQEFLWMERPATQK